MEVRAEVCKGLECLGLNLDETKNGACEPDADVAMSGGGRILVMRTREDIQMLRELASLACHAGGPVEV